MDTITQTPVPPAEWMTAGPATRKVLAAAERIRAQADRDAEIIRREIPPERQGEEHIVRGAFVASGPWHPYGRQAVWALRDEASDTADRLVTRILDRLLDQNAAANPGPRGQAVDLLMSIGQGPGRAYLDGIADGVATTVFGVAAAEASVVTGPDYLVLVGPWRRARFPGLIGDWSRALPAGFPGTPAAGEPLHTVTWPFIGQDVDEDLAAAREQGTARTIDHHRPAHERLWHALGLPMEQVEGFNAGWPTSGLYRRLAATLQSIAERRDANTDWAVAPPEHGERDWPFGRPGPGGDDRDRERGSFRLRWWSDGGSSGSRAWHIEATVSVAVDDWLATHAMVRDVTLAVTGTDGELTRYRAAEGLSEVLGGLVLRLLARDTVRVLAGAESHRTPWVDSPTLGVWVEDVT